MLCLNHISGDKSIKLTEWNKFVEPVEKLEELDYWIDRLNQLNKTYAVASYRVYITKDDVLCSSITNEELINKSYKIKSERIYSEELRGRYFITEKGKIIYISRDGIDIIRDKSKTVYAMFTDEGDLLE